MNNSNNHDITIAGQQRGPFVTAVESSRLPMMFTSAADVERRIVFVNDAFVKLTGYERHEAVGEQLNFLLPGSDAEIEKRIERAFAGEEESLCCRRRDGSLFWVCVMISPVVDDDVTTHFFTSFIDMTEHLAELARIRALSADVARKANEVRTLQTGMVRGSRLSAMGVIGATMAHELNQPLAAITNYLRGARLRLQAAAITMPEGVSDALALADQSAIRASQIIRRVRDIARRKPGAERLEVLDRVIEEACDLAFADARSNDIETVTEFCADGVEVLVDRIEIQQVVINLIYNAMDAVADRPVRLVSVETAIRSDSVCEVIVRDTGDGIKAETVNHLFEPFKSTKVNGVGIGLSISRTLVEAHGGKLWLESSTSAGAEFRFSLPIHL